MVVAALGLALAPAAAQVPAKDRARFAQAHSQLVQQFGGVYEGPGAALVTRVGKAMAIQSGLSRDGSDCTVTLLNTDVVNAFAVPGCYVYVTRGLLAITSDEAELASVLGHEIGHVAARHAQKRENRSLLTGLGVLAATVLTGSSDVGALAGQVGQLTVLGYSRSQEYEADSLGIRYMVKAGYDPYASADMLEALGRDDRLKAKVAGRDESAQVPAWGRTHPMTEDRVARSTSLARATKMQPGQGRRDRAGYLAAINGMTYGDDPAQGYVNGRDFAHPGLRIAFRAPPGFMLQNSPTAVLLKGPNGEQAQFGGGSLRDGETLPGYAARVARAVVGNTPAQAGDPQERQVNGVPAALLPVRASTSRGIVNFAVAAYAADNRAAYHFVMLGNAGSPALRELAMSFRRLSPSETANLRPRVIAVETVRPGDTVESMAARMAFPDLAAERFRALNDLGPGERLVPGTQVKIVRQAR